MGDDSMQDERYAGELPNLAAEVSADGEACEACGHPTIVAPRHPSFLRTVLGMKPRPAACLVKEHDESGLGAMPCECRDASHGS